MAVYDTTPTYLITMPEVVIAQDIACTITDHNPGATVIVAQTAAEAEAALATVAVLTLAFLAESPSTFAQSALAKSIARRRGRVVLLGDAAEAAGPTPDWAVLHQPFDTNAVLTILSQG